MDVWDVLFWPAMAVAAVVAIVFSLRVDVRKLESYDNLQWFHWTLVVVWLVFGVLSLFNESHDAVGRLLRSAVWTGLAIAELTAIRRRRDYRRQRADSPRG